jgi:hypothetical protein
VPPADQLVDDGAADASAGAKDDLQVGGHGSSLGSATTPTGSLGLVPIRHPNGRSGHGRAHRPKVEPEVESSTFSSTFGRCARPARRPRFGTKGGRMRRVLDGQVMLLDYRAAPTST